MAVSGKKEVYGGFASVNLRKPDLKQDDPKKGDYVKGKDAFAKVEDIPTKPEDIGAQPVGNYLQRVPDGYATEEWVQEGFQPKGEYLTKIPDGYAKTSDIPTKPEDIGAQPSGNYLTEVPEGYATKEFVTNKIAEAELGGEEVDLSGYAQKSEIPTKTSQLTNDSGYLTEVPEGYAKDEDIPTKPEDIGAQPAGNYALKSEIPSVPVQSVNGKTGAVQLSASDVGARPSTWMPSASDVGALPSSTKIPAKTSELTNDSGFITGYTETDPTVPAWAKNATKPSYTASEVGALPSTTKIPSKTSDLTNDSGFITGYTETDPTVPSWAKASSKPSYSKSEVGLGNVDNVKQYSASNPPPYPVTSVNGKTGAVTVDVPTKISQLTNDAGYLTGHRDTSLTMFIAPDGSDSNDGFTADKPKKTVKACVNAGATKISAKRGVYKEVVQLWDVGELEIFPTDNDLTYAAGTVREPIVFDTSDIIAVSSLASYNAIKRVAYSNTNNTQFDKVFTKQSQPPVIGEGYGSRYNSTIWLLSDDEKAVCIKLKPVLTVAECEAEANTFTYVSGYIYINASMTGVDKIIVPTSWETGFYINGADKLVLKEVEVRFSGAYNIDIRNCAYFDFYKCSCKYTSYASGFHPFNSNGRMTACYATKNYDGYGISGYGHTTYIDCVSEFNFDDGMSHHDGTSGTVIGGRYEGNGKGGNTPAYGAKVNIYGGLYKDNASFGIGYLWATDYEPASGVVQGAVMVGNPVGLAVNKNCDVTAMNCTYKDNAVDLNNAGNLVEYNPAYAKTVNGIKPDENGNVKIEVSGGETTGYTNVLPLAINSDGTLFVGANGEKGYKTGCRISSSGVEKDSDRNNCTGFISCKAGDIVRMKNITIETTGYSQVYFFSAAFAKVSGVVALGDLQADSNGVYSLTVPDNVAGAYMRITVGTFTSDSIITVNEEITD